MSNQHGIIRRPEAGELSPYTDPRPYLVDRRDDPDEGLDWSRVRRGLRRYGWLALPFALLGGSAAYVMTRNMSKDYRASTTIWLAGKGEANRPDASIGPIRHGELLDATAWVDLLRSYAVLEPVARDLRLYVTPDLARDTTALQTLFVVDDFRPGHYTLTGSPDGTWQLANDNNEVVERGTQGDSVGTSVGLRWLPDPAVFSSAEPVRFTLTTFRQAAEDLGRALDVRTDDRSSFMRVDLRGRDPGRTAAILNQVAQRYVALAADLKARRLTELSRILDDQRNAARSELDRAERALEDFRVRTVGLPTDIRPDPRPVTVATAGPDPSGLTAVSTELDRVRRDRQAIERWLATPSEQRSVNGPLLANTDREAGEFTSALDELARMRSDLRSLQYKYQEAHPMVQRLEENVRTLRDQTIPALARGLAVDLAQRERDLAVRVDTLTRTLRGVPARVSEQARLERAATIASELYTTLQGRYQEARLAEASSIPDVRVLDAAAVPQRPLSDQTRRLIAFGVVAGIALGLAIAVLLDRFDPRVRYPSEVSQNMGLTILGAVPHLRGRRGDALSPAAADQVTEALRGVRVALTHGGHIEGPLTLTISSPGAGDGKSFLSANLGLSFALAGYRTLIVDGDVRRGVLHRGFNLKRRPGLTDYLRGDEGLREIIQATAFPGLSLIGSGTRTRHAPELLSKPGTAALFAELKNDFDVILCDSPPLVAGVDPLLLSTITGRLLLVLRTGVSMRNVAEAKLAVLDRLPVDVVGAVMNDVPPGNLYRPYTYHLRGYEAADEIEPAGALPVV
jgi:succinoglycan biosynthesis transport protein ExoP